MCDLFKPDKMKWNGMDKKKEVSKLRCKIMIVLTNFPIYGKSYGYLKIR